MPAQLIVYLWIALAAPFVLLGLLVFALFRRYRDRAVPTWAKWSGAFLTGFCVSPAFLLGDDPLWFVIPSLPVIWVAFLFARTGRLRMAGLMALGLTLPPAAYWASLLLADVAEPVALYGQGLLLRFLVVATGVVMGIGLVVVGDNPDSRPRLVAQPPGTARDPMGLGNTMAANLMFGPFTLPGFTAELTAFLVTVVVISGATWLGVPWPLRLFGGALLFMLIGTELWYAAFPPRARKAWGGYSYVGHHEMARWRASTGTRPPASPAEFQAWLRDNVERPETRWAHAEMLAVVGRLDEARALAERVEATTPAEAYDRQSTLDYIEWIAGGEVDFDGRFRAADEIGAPGSEERLYARGQASIALARERAATGGDWMQPLIALDEEVGPAGWASWRTDTRRRRMMGTFLLGLVLSAVSAIPAAFLPSVL